jgi:hypothetical protein
MSRIEFPKVHSKYGAPMGRGGVEPRDLVTLTAHAPDCRLFMHRVEINGGGYDSGGAYWGHGKPLWRAWFVDANGDEVETFFRAWTRDEAKAQFPGRRFYR